LTTAGNDLLIIDCGTGAHPLAVDLATKGKSAFHSNILIGHTHWDHIQGFPFFTTAFERSNTIAIHGPEGGGRSLHDVLSGQMEFTYFPVELSQLPAAITYRDLAEGIHTIGGARVATQYLHHPATTLGYRIEADGVAVVYLVDHEPFSEQLWRADAEPGCIESILHEGDRRHARFMADADLVIHDAQYTPEEYFSKKTWGHSTYEYVVEVAAAAGVRRVALTHHDPDHDDRFVATIERRARALASQRGAALDVFCAYEGCEIVLEPQAALKAFETTHPLRASTIGQRSFRILVVDDEPDIRALCTLALKRDQHAVLEAGSGAEALRMIKEQRPDLVVVDFMMPGMDGIEVVKALRATSETKRLPVLMLTAMADEASTRAGFEAGVTDYVTKPFSIPQLTARVRACLARTAIG
jgi:CheY-like chemotaxis protein/phosphoribosyl 1,2-cyclic phosphodiesterase